MGDWARALTSKSFFILAFVIVSAIGVAKMLGISDSDILETAVTAAIATVVSSVLTFFVFRSASRGARRG